MVFCWGHIILIVSVKTRTQPKTSTCMYEMKTEKYEDVAKTRNSENSIMVLSRSSEPNCSYRQVDFIFIQIGQAM